MHLSSGQAEWIAGTLILKEQRVIAMKFTLRTKVLLVVAGVVAGLSLATLTVVAYLINQEVSGMALNDAQSKAAALHATIDRVSVELTQSLTTLARQASVRRTLLRQGGITKGEQDETSAYVRGALPDLHASALVMTDKSGVVRGRAGDSELQPEGGATKALNGAVWNGVQTSGDRFTIAVSVPVVAGGEPQGTLTAYRTVDTASATLTP